MTGISKGKKILVIIVVLSVCTNYKYLKGLHDKIREVKIYSQLGISQPQERLNEEIRNEDKLKKTENIEKLTKLDEIKNNNNVSTSTSKSYFTSQTSTSKSSTSEKIMSKDDL